MTVPASPSRRRLLQTGVAGTALLVLAYVLHRPLDRWGKRALVAQAPLDAAMREVLPALIPVVLNGALPGPGPQRDAALRQAQAAVGTAVSRLSAAAQREVAELFALLALAPTRIAVAGLSAAWADADAVDIAAFLARWRSSRIALLQSGYAALHDLILGAWYADLAAWASIGYPGPPKVEFS